MRDVRDEILVELFYVVWGDFGIFVNSYNNEEG